jgi:hypothetical protein
MSSDTVDPKDESAQLRPERKLPDETFARGHVVVTPSAVVFTLTDEHREAMKHCLDTNGRVSFTFREVSVSDLMEAKALDGPDGGVTVD